VTSADTSLFPQRRSGGPIFSKYTSLHVLCVLVNLNYPIISSYLRVHQI
jgi:hypothetical protein